MWKGGHGIVSADDNLSVYCAYEGEAGIDESIPSVDWKEVKKVSWGKCSSVEKKTDNNSAVEMF